MKNLYFQGYFASQLPNSDKVLCVKILSHFHWHFFTVSESCVTQKRLTQRAADFWESAASRSIFLASSFSTPNQSPRPPQRHSPQGKSANANRWALAFNLFAVSYY
jgi:hypothetical protein